MERTRANLKRALMDSDVRSKVMKRDTLYMSYITVRSAKHAKAVVGFGGNLPPLPIRGGVAPLLRSHACNALAKPTIHSTCMPGSRFSGRQAWSVAFRKVLGPGLVTWNYLRCSSVQHIVSHPTRRIIGTWKLVNKRKKKKFEVKFKAKKLRPTPTKCFCKS